MGATSVIYGRSKSSIQIASLVTKILWMVEMGCDLTSYPISFSMNPSKGRAALSNAVINQFKVFYYETFSRQDH